MNNIASGIHELRDHVARMKKALGDGSAKQVRSERVRGVVKDLVGHYFNDVRPDLKKAGLDNESLGGLDKWMQDLLSLAQRSALRSIYRTTIRSMESEINGVELAALTAGSTDQVSTGIELDARESRIVNTLEAMVPTAARSYEQACLDLRNMHRKSYRGAATELRETLREVLDHLAPDKAVASQEGFALERNQQKPTMKQKTRYVLVSRGMSKALTQTPEAAVGVVEESVASLARSVYKRSSVSTHVGTTRQEVQNIKAYIDVVLAELLELS